MLVFGTICLDRLRGVPTLPGAGGYVEIQSERLLLGGEAANTALALQTWGARIALCGNMLGDPPEGERLLQLLTDHKLPVDHVSLGGGRTPETDVYVTPDGERTMFGRGFSSMGPSEPVDSLPFEPGAWFTADPNMDAPSRAALLAAHQAGMRVYAMDFVHGSDSIPAGGWWQSSTDWVGTRAEDVGNAAWLTSWIERHGCFGVLTDGPRQFWLGGPGVPVRALPTFPASSVVDTTGAGDLFRAGMLFGLSQDWPLSRTAAFAAAAGALACRAYGGTSFLPPASEVEALVAAHPEVQAAYESLG